MRFSNILLVHDSDTCHSLALRHAITLARNEHATLTICDVVDRVPSGYLRTITAVTPREMVDAVAARKFEKLEKAIHSAKAGDLSIQIKVLVGKPQVEIARLVQEQHHDVVIKPICGHSDRAIKRADRELLRFCPCPVWLISDVNQPNNGCVLAALDHPADDAAGAELNEHILEVSRSIALAEFRRLHVVHAWELTGESHMRTRGTAATELELDRMILREEARQMDWLRQTVNSAPSDSQRVATDFLAPTLHAIKGSPRIVIPGLAERLGAGLIVMGSAARTGVSGILLGNTSERVLSRSDSSFLIVKHPDRWSERALHEDAWQGVPRAVQGSGQHEPRQSVGF